MERRGRVALLALCGAGDGLTVLTHIPPVILDETRMLPVLPVNLGGTLAVKAEVHKWLWDCKKNLCNAGGLDQICTEKKHFDQQC